MKNISFLKIIAALCICNLYVFSCGVMGEIESGVPVKDSETGGGTNESSEAPLSDDTGEAENSKTVALGTIDFLAPENGNSEKKNVHIETLYFQRLTTAQRVIDSSYGIKVDDSPIIIGGDNSEDETDIIVDTYEPTEEAPVPEKKPAATTTTSKKPKEETSIIETPETAEPPSTTTAATTTSAPETTSASSSSSEPSDTSSTASTPASTPNNLVTGGIKVDDDQPDILPVETSENTSSSSTSETKPSEILTNEDAANEILYVKDGGTTVSGKALDIISRITQNEIGQAFAPEAIKAQAVAAYTYVKYCNKYGSYPSVALSDNVSDSVRVLVASVIGQAVYYDGAYIQAVYSASSAGYSASSLNTWGNDFPYLQSVYCELDAQYDPNYGRTAQFSSSEIKERVLKKTGIELSGDPSSWLLVDEHIDGKYVGQMNVGGYHSYSDSAGASIKITGRIFREKIMDYDIRSHAFDISYDSVSDMFTFTTYGYGHGVGMSQNGANALATYLGYDYKQILQYYYKGTEIH